MVGVTFVCYSRKDVDLVSAIVRLLRAALAGVVPSDGASRELVFQDVDTILPGARWREAVAAAIDRCEQMLVFWCAHSTGSEEVRVEYNLGLTGGKIVVPVLLDSTSLPSDLAPVQGVDLRGLGLHVRGGRKHRGPISSLADILVHEFAPFLRVDPDRLIDNLVNKGVV